MKINGTLDTNYCGEDAIELHLETPEGLVDLVFADLAQFLAMVAGQHLDTARRLLGDDRLESEVDPCKVCSEPCQGLTANSKTPACMR